MDVSRKQRSPWPWVVGAAVLIVIVWSVTLILRPATDDTTPATAPPLEEAVPPAAIPAPPGMIQVRSGGPSAGLVPVDRLAEEHVGRTAQLTGEVVVTGNERFWLLADGEVLRVDSSRRVRNGQAVSVTGVVRSADPETTDRVAAEVLARRPSGDHWILIRGVKLVEEGETPAAGAPSAGARPGA